jgi:hypothetical protein
MATTTRRPSTSTSNQPMLVYIPSRLATGIPSQRRKTSAKQQTSHTESQLQQSAQQKMYTETVLSMHRKNVKYILRPFVAEQLECERSVLPFPVIISGTDLLVGLKHQNAMIVYSKTLRTRNSKCLLNDDLHVFQGSRYLECGRAIRVLSRSRLVASFSRQQS